MGNYIDETDITALFDTDSIAVTHDETIQDVIADIIGKREAVFEGYAKKQYSDLTALRAAKPEQAQAWITDMAIYDLHKRRGAAPQEVKDQYLQTVAELKDFAKTGIPELISNSVVAPNGRTFGGNMTEDDLGKFPWESENIVSPTKDML